MIDCQEESAMNIRHAIIAVAAGALTFVSQIVLSDSDDGEHRHGRSKWLERSADVAPVNNAAYAKECGECHFAYQPGLLPERSWRKIMSGLSDHFGDNADLAPEQRDQLMKYLAENSAEHSSYRRSEKIMRSVGTSEAPLRITELRYIRNKHDEVPARLIKANEKVRSLSNCAACHTRADAGSFSEREIDIPGAGRWEDD
jgi:hypothetical protein